MAGSTELRAVVGRIRQLRKTFLPAPSPVGSYSTAEYDRTSAFLLLVHAEVEWFIERRCLAVAKASVQKWEQDSKARSATLALAGFSYSKGDSLLALKASGGRPRIRLLVADAKKAYSSAVAQNHGIKEENLLRLLLPIGVRESQLPSGFLAEMNTFGANRGDQAHVGVGARTPADPVGSLQMVTRVLVGLRQLEQHLGRLEAE